jgi:hypothetical protein
MGTLALITGFDYTYAPIHQIINYQIKNFDCTRHWGFLETSRRLTARDLPLCRKAPPTVSEVRDVFCLDGKDVGVLGCGEASDWLALNPWGYSEVWPGVRASPLPAPTTTARGFLTSRRRVDLPQ